MEPVQRTNRNVLTRQISQHANEIEESSDPQAAYAVYDLKYGAEHVMKLFVAVSLCMLVVIFTIGNVNFYTRKDIYLLYTPFHETSPETFTKVWNAVANSLILIAVVVIMTMFLIMLYKYRFYKVISAWLICSTLMLMFLFSSLFFEEMLRSYNIPMDVITAFLFNWNFGFVGMMCIHWKGPHRIQQAYLIFIAALMALVFIKYLPEWTTWVVLFSISIWDLIAVLTPRGPLKILVETAQERNEQIFPSLIYSAVAYSTALMANRTTEESNIPDCSSSPSTEREVLVIDGDENENENGSSIQSENVPRSENNSDEIMSYSTSDPPLDQASGTNPFIRPKRQVVASMADDGIKLGLGDFIFYSVLVGKASSYGDWNTTLACFVAVLIGLSMTLLLLATFKKALPALPISICIGLVFYFCTRTLVKPFADYLSLEQIFV